MRFTIIALTCLCMVMSTVPGLAKEKNSEMQMDMQAMMEMYKKLATPGVPHKLFASLAGNWTTQMKEWMEPGKPPVESTGTAEMKMLLGGRFLYQEFIRDRHAERIRHWMTGKARDSLGISGAVVAEIDRLLPRPTDPGRFN